LRPPQFPSQRTDAFQPPHRIEFNKASGCLDKGTGGVVLKTPLDHTKEQALRDAIADAPPAVAPATSTI